MIYNFRIKMIKKVVMQLLKRNLELVEIKNLQEVYHLTRSLFSKRKNIKETIEEFNKDTLIKKIMPHIKSECIVCNDIISKDNTDNTSKIDNINNLYDFFNEFNDIFGENITKKLLKKIGFVESHIKELINSLNNVSDFRSHLSVEEVFQWDNKNYLQSTKAHKEVSERKVELDEDVFKPLISYFINDLSKDKKAEFLLKLDLFKKSGWAEYIIKEGSKEKNPDIVKLFDLFKEVRNSKEGYLDIKKQKEFKSAFERFFEEIEVGINVNQKGLNIATINHKKIGLYNLAQSGMPDGAVIGCPHVGRGEHLYVGWATANMKKFAQNLQWFRHLEGIEFSIKMKRAGFEKFSMVDGSIVSLAINHDEEGIGFIRNEIKEEEKKSFQILGEATEICKGLVIQNGRYKNLVDKISSISLIGSKSELLLGGKKEKEIKNVLLNIVKNVNNALTRAIEGNELTNSHKIKREIYLNDFCNAISYLSEINKQNIEFKEFLNKDISKTFIGLAKMYPEMSQHLSKTLSFAIMNAEGIVFEALNKIEDNAAIGFNKDYLQRSLYHFDEKAKNISHGNKEIDDFIEDAFEEIKNPLYEIICKIEGYNKLDKSKENALWYMLKTEVMPAKSLLNYDKEMKMTVSKFKNKKTSNKCIEFFKEIQKGFPHLTLLSTVEESKMSKKERLMHLLKVQEIYEAHIGMIDVKINKDKMENLNLIKQMTKNALKDIEILEKKVEKEIKKELANLIEEVINEKNMTKSFIIEEMNNSEFQSDIKKVLMDLINNKKEVMKKI